MAFSLTRLLNRLGAAITPKISNDIPNGGLSMAQFADMFSFPTWSGADVTPESASRAIPVQACIALISGGITSMPLRIVSREIVDGAWLQTPADNHPYWWLFNESPDGEISASQFWDRIVKHKLLFGEAFARMIRSSGGRGIDIQQIIFEPNRNVQTMRQWDPIARRAKIVGYQIRRDGRTFGVLPEDMLHFRDSQALTPTDSISVPADGTSIAPKPTSSILDATRQAIGVCLTIEEYCGRFFSNGGMPKIVLKYPVGQKLDKIQIDALSDQFQARYGSASAGGKPLIINNGGDAMKLSFTSEEAQLLEARKFQVIDIARGFGVPPFMIGETEKTSAWGTGIESMSQGFIRYSLARHITELQQESTRKCFGIARYCTDFDEEALSRGDMSALGIWFRAAAGGAQGPGWMSVNEIRRRMNLAAVPGGDELYNPTGGEPDADDTQATPGADGGKPGQAKTARNIERRWARGDRLSV
jgi:HK97 family phage portal protein